MTTPRANLILQHLRRLAAHLEELSDRELLHRFARQHDEEAFARLMRRHRPLVQGVGLRVLGNWHDSEDVTQAVFLVLARKAASLRWHDSVACWLYRVAYHLALKAKAASERRQSKEHQAAGRAAPDAFDGIRLSEARTLLDEELAALPERYRAPILLCCLEAITQEEAARQLSCSLATLKRRLTKGRELLRVRLARRGLTLSAVLTPALLAPEPGAAAAMTLSSPSAVAQTLAEGALRGMTVAKLKIAAALVLTASVLTGGTGLLMLPGHSQPQAAPLVGETDQLKRATVQAARTDRYGDPLPPRALARLGTVRFRPGDPIAQIAFSPDGKLLAATTENMEANANLVSISLWDRATGKRLRQFAASKRPPFTFIFAPDGKTLATQDERGAIHLWDVGTGKELRRIAAGGMVFETTPTGQGLILGSGLVFSPDGKAVAARGADKAIHLWETVTGKELRKFPAGPEDVAPLAFSRDGKMLATSAKKMIRFWDVKTGKEKARLLGHEGLAGTPAFSADGKTFAALARTPGQLYQMTAYVWDIAAAKLLHKWDLPANPVFASCMSPDGKIVLVGSGGDLCLHDLSTGKQVRRLSALITGATAIFSAVFSPDGKIVAAGGQNRVLQLWDVESGKPLQPFAGHQGALNSLSLSTNGKYLASTAGDNRLFLWDMATAQLVAAFQSPKARFVDVAFAPDDRRLAVVGEYPFVRLLEVPSGKEIRRLPCDRDRQNSVAFSPDGRLIAAGSGYTSDGSRDKSIRLWETSTGKVLHKMPVPRIAEHDGGLLCLAFSPDGRLLASGGYGEAAHVWNVFTGQLYCQLPGHHYWVSSLRFSPDGQTLATTHWDREKRTIRLWEVRSGKERGQLSGHTDRVSSLAFAPDGRFASAGDDKTIRIWDLNTGAETECLRGHESVVGPLAFSSDGQRLISGGWDTTILIWDLKARPQPRSAPAAVQSAKDLEALWTALAGDDAAKAYRAIAELSADPEQTVPLLRQHLRPVHSPDPRRLARLVAELDSERFEVREKAGKQIEEIGELAKPSLLKALEGKPSLEVRRRIELLLINIEPAHSPAQLRALRAVEVLEHVGTPEARRVLETLASGAAEARLTRESKAALARLVR